MLSSSRVTENIVESWQKGNHLSKHSILDTKRLVQDVSITQADRV